MKKIITLILAVAMVITMAVPSLNVSANMGTGNTTTTPQYYKGVRVNDNTSYSTILNDGIYFSALEYATATSTYRDADGNTTAAVDSLYETIAEGGHITFEFSSSCDDKISAIHLWLRGINKIKTYRVEVADGKGGWSLAKEGSFYRELTPSEQAELQDRSYAHTIVFDGNRTQNSSVTLRFTPTELADGVESVQIAEAYLGFDGITLNYYSDPSLIYGYNGSISSGKGVGELSAQVTMDSSKVGSPGSDLRKKGKSPYFYNYKASGDEKNYGANGITHAAPGTIWPYNPSSNDSAVANVISDENGCWYMADLDLSGQPVNFISTTIPKDSAAVKSYEILISNDKAAWDEGPTSDKWKSLKKSEFRRSSTSSAVTLMTTVPDAPNARFWLIRLYGSNNGGNEGIKMGFTKLYYADRTQREKHSSASETIAWAASDAFKKLAADKALPATISVTDGKDNKSYTYNLSWKIGGAAVTTGTAVSFDTADKNVELEIKGYGGSGTSAFAGENDVVQTYTRHDFIPALGAELDGTKAAAEALKYKAVANNVNENTKVFFALYTDSTANELVSVTPASLTADGFAYSASYTVPGTYTDGMTVKAFLWDEGTLTPLTTTIPTK